MLIRTSCAEQHPGIEIRGCRLVLEPERRGKTTLAIHLATRLAERGSVLRVDEDPRGFALGFRAQPQLPAGFPVAGSAKPTLQRDTGALGENLDWALVASPRGVLRCLGPPSPQALSRWFRAGLPCLISGPPGTPSTAWKSVPRSVRVFGRALS